MLNTLAFFFHTGVFSGDSLENAFKGSIPYINGPWMNVLRTGANASPPSLDLLWRCFNKDLKNHRRKDQINFNKSKRDNWNVTFLWNDLETIGKSRWLGSNKIPPKQSAGASNFFCQASKGPVSFPSAAFNNSLTKSVSRDFVFR